MGQATFESRPSAKLQPAITVHVEQDSEAPSAYVLATKGRVEVSENGGKFRKVKQRELIREGAIVRTGSSGRIDLYLKRMGSAVRLKKNGEIKLEQMDRNVRADGVANSAVIAVRKGTMLTVAKADVPNSSLEVKNAAGRATIQQNPVGRYIVTAEKTQLIPTEAKMAVRADEKFTQETTPVVQEQLEFDELQALADEWSAELAQTSRP